MAIRLVALVVSFLIAVTGVASAQSNPPNPRSAIVRVQVVGQNSENGKETAVLGSGFYVSPDGFIATSNHLVDLLFEQDPKIDRQSVRVEISEGLHSQWIPADVFESNKALDYLILQVFVDGRETPYLPWASDARKLITLNHTPVFTAGFPVNDGYRAFRGQMTAFQGPPVPRGLLWMWRAAIASNEGQSGSPVYLEDGSVVGILRGADIVQKADVYIVPESIIRSDRRWAKTPDTILPKIVVNQIVRSYGASLVTRFATNDSCNAEESIHNWQIRPTAGWKIDESSLRIVETVQQGKARIVSTYFSPEETTISASLENIGQCWLFQSDTVGKLGIAVGFSQFIDNEQPVLTARAVPQGRYLIGQRGEPVSSIDVVEADGTRKRLNVSGLSTDGRFEIVADGDYEYLKVK